MTPPQAVFFDLDGTLLDSLPGIGFSVQHAFTACSLQPQHTDLRSHIGPPIRVIFSQLAPHLADADLDRLERAFRTSYDTEGWRMTPHFPGAPKLLRDLQSIGTRLFVVSNKPIHIATLILRAEGTLDLFEEVVTRDSRNPPYAGKLEMLQHLIASHGFDSTSCLMVGDTMEDATAAAAASVGFAFVRHGYGDVPASVPVALRLDDLSEFLPLLTKELHIDR
jgi:phosphoglycolate phosphatase